MDTYNIHDTRTHLSRLLKEVQRGKPFVIAKAGKPIAQVTRIETPPREPGERLGFLAGQIEVPEDFDRMGESSIARRSARCAFHAAAAPGKAGLRANMRLLCERPGGQG